VGHISLLEAETRIIKHHHERWDGNGYPDGLAGEDIPFLARILAVADTYDAMTSNRPYRPPLPHEVALKEIRQNAGTQFDPLVAEAFLDLWAQKEREEATHGRSMPKSVA
jgi:HD-GYP domain-containing protein (c-di-GMP phosphodiesterase class II)